MATVMKPADSLVRAHGRGLLLATFENEVILTKLRVTYGGNFLVETKVWSQYWAPVSELSCVELKGCLNTLRCAWRAYLNSGFSAELRREYCFRYFFLLNRLLSKSKEVGDLDTWAEALKTVLGF